MQFDGPIDLDRIGEPGATMQGSSPLFLVDIDAQSPYRGELFPVQVWFEEDRTTYQPGNLLAVAPVFGFPLRPRTRYGLVVTTDLAEQNPDFADVLEPGHPDHALYADLVEVLPHLGLRESRWRSPPPSPP